MKKTVIVDQFASQSKAADGKLPGSTGDRLELMQTFVRIVEAGNLSAAAQQLGTTQPTISRRLQALEKSLGVRLLQRSTHTMRLTIDGERHGLGAMSLRCAQIMFDNGLHGYPRDEFSAGRQRRTQA